MKIVVIVPYLTRVGGAARYAWELSEYLTSKKDQVLVVSLYADRNIYDSKLNLKVIDLADESNLTQTIKFWITLRKISKKLADLIIIEKPDVVLFNHFPCTLWAQKYGNIPILAYPQDVNFLYTDTYINNLSIGKRFLWKILRLFIRPYDKKKWKCFDHVICNSNFSASNISKSYEINPLVIYPGTNTQKFKPSNMQSKKRAILTMGDARNREADFLIKAASMLYKKRNDFKIWVVGTNNEQEKELRKLVQKYNLTTVVEFFGKVSDSKLAELYSQSLVTTHLIKEAPFGLIAIEAMACGTPVIAWKPSGTEETIVDGETGFLINENNYEDLIGCMEKFLDDPKLSLTMGQKASIRIQNYFEMNKQYDELRNFMQKCIDEKIAS